MVTDAPSACAANIVHDFTDSPSIRTVHAPHEDVSHPILVPVSAARLAEVLHEQRARFDVVVLRAAVHRHADLHAFPLESGRFEASRRSGRSARPPGKTISRSRPDRRP